MYVCFGAPADFFFGTQQKSRLVKIFGKEFSRLVKVFVVKTLA